MPSPTAKSTAWWRLLAVAACREMGSVTIYINIYHRSIYIYIMMEPWFQSFLCRFIVLPSQEWQIQQQSMEVLCGVLRDRDNQEVECGKGDHHFYSWGHFSLHLLRMALWSYFGRYHDRYMYIYRVGFAPHGQAPNEVQLSKDWHAPVVPAREEPEELQHEAQSPEEGDSRLNCYKEIICIGLDTNCKTIFGFQLDSVQILDLHAALKSRCVA